LPIGCGALFPEWFGRWWDCKKNTTGTGKLIGLVFNTLR